VEVVASLSQGRTAAAQYGLFTHKSVPVIFEPPCITYNNMMFYIVKYTVIWLFFVEATRRQLSSQEIKMMGSRGS